MSSVLQKIITEMVTSFGKSAISLLAGRQADRIKAIGERTLDTSVSTKCDSIKPTACPIGSKSPLVRPIEAITLQVER